MSSNWSSLYHRPSPTGGICTYSVVKPVRESSAKWSHFS